MKLIQQEKTLATAAAKAGMDEKTARKYRDSKQLPSQMKPEHNWRTRKDPFEGVWEEVQAWLEVNAGLEAKTLFGVDPVSWIHHPLGRRNPRCREHEGRILKSSNDR